MVVSAPAGSAATTTLEDPMTCPACNLPTAPGAYCDGNGSHPPRRAKRLTGEERRAAQREAETRREAERTHAALVAVARPVVESAQQRRYLYRCGDLAEELAEAVRVGLITWEDAARLEAETAAEVAAMDAERARRRAEYEAWVATNPPADAVDVGAPAGRDVFTGNGVGPQADWRWITDGAYCYSGQPGEHPVKAGQIVQGVRPVFGKAERVNPPEPRRRSSHRRAIGIVALAGALMGMGGLTREDI